MGYFLAEQFAVALPEPVHGHLQLRRYLLDDKGSATYAEVAAA